MSKVLFIIDMQNDFLTGILGSEACNSIVKDVASFAQGFDGKIFFTKDTHYKDNYKLSQEGKHLPLHCEKNSVGWEICNELLALLTKDNCINKVSFGSVDIHKYVTEGDDIFLVGVCTDICVVSNALLLRAHFPNNNITVIENLCKGTSRENHDAAIKTMKSCFIDIV